MVVAILEEDPKRRRLTIYGNTSELQERLKENLHPTVAGGEAQVRESFTNGFLFLAWLELLEPYAIPIPDNTDVPLQPPTAEGEGEMSSRFGYNKLFDCPSLTGTHVTLPSRPGNVIPRKLKHQRNIPLSRTHETRDTQVPQLRTLVRPNLKHIQSCGLELSLHPMN